MPVNVTRMFGTFSAGNYNNGSAFLQPVYKTVTVISLVRNHMFTPSIKWFQKILPIAYVIAVPWKQQRPQRASQ